MSNWKSFRIFSLILTGIGFNLAATNSALAVQPLQIFTALANTPSKSVVQGLVTFNPNTTTVEYCLASPFGAESQCATSNLASALGSLSGIVLQSRLDNGSSGTIPLPGGQTGQQTPVLHPALYVARIMASDQSFQGYIVVALSVTTDSSGLLKPVISSPF